jgi:hypothetical protein
MPITTERAIPERVIPVFESTGEFKGLRASVNFAWESRDSWISKRNLIADRALVERAAELGFGKRFLFGFSETYQQLKMRKLLDRYAAGGEIKTKSQAVVRATSELDALIDNRKEEADFMAAALGYGTLNDSGRVRVLENDRLQQEFSVIAKELIDGYVQGDIDEKELEERAAAISDELKDIWSNSFRDGEVGTDIVPVAKEIKAACKEHDVRICEVDVNLAEVYGGLTTREKKDLAQKIVDASEAHPILSTIFNPLTVGVGSSAAAFAAKVPTKYIPVIGGLAGGAIAAVRRYGKEGKDRNLKQREEEAGFVAESKKSKDGFVAKVLGKTDFSEFSYKPVSALEAAEVLSKGADVYRDSDKLSIEAKVELEGILIEQLAGLEARLNVSEELGRALIKFGEQRDENGEIVTSGLASLNRDRLNLVSTIADLKHILRKSMPAEMFDLRFDIEYKTCVKDLREMIKRADRRFAKSRIDKTLRSGTFAAITGMAGGFGIHLAGEGAESLAEDSLEGAKSELIEVREKVGNLDIPDAGAVVIPQGFAGELRDGKLILKKGEDVYEMPWVKGMSVTDAQKALNEAGFDAEVRVETVTHVAPDRTETSISGVLSPDFQEASGLSEIKHKNFDIDFAKGRELTLHTSGGRDWFVAPMTGVDEKNLVAFYQVRDAAGEWHTMLADTTDGRFNIPSEFVGTDTGKIDKISVIGYGRVYDSAGNVVEAETIVQNPDLIRGGRLESMASVALDQKEAPAVVTKIIPGETSTLSTIKITDLTKIDYIETEVASDYDLSKYFPPIATPVDVRIFPAVAQYRNPNSSGFSSGVPNDKRESGEKSVDEHTEPGESFRQDMVWEGEKQDYFEMAREDEKRSELEAAIIAAAIKDEEEKEEDDEVIEQVASTIVPKRTFLDWAKMYSRNQAAKDTRESFESGENAKFQADLRTPVSVSLFRLIQLNWRLMRMGGYLTEEEFEDLVRKFGIKINTLEKIRSAYLRKKSAYPLNWRLMRMGGYLTEEEFEDLVRKFGIKINTLEKIRSAYLRKKSAYPLRA